MVLQQHNYVNIRNGLFERVDAREGLPANEPLINLWIVERDIRTALQEYFCDRQRRRVTLVSNILFVSDTQKKNFGILQSHTGLVKNVLHSIYDVAWHRVVDFLSKFNETEWIPE
ncbi:hypothetical protein D3C74_411010 [compost metagenome]